MFSFKTLLVCPAILAGFTFALLGNIRTADTQCQAASNTANSLWLEYSLDAPPLLIGYGDTITVKNKTETPVTVEFFKVLGGPVAEKVQVNPGDEISRLDLPVVRRIRIQSGDDVEGSCAIDCLAGGTLVQTSKGTKPVEMVEPGILVLCNDGSHQQVESIQKRLTSQLVELSLGSEVLRTSLGHEFMLASGEWEQASDLEVGMQLLVGQEEANYQQVAVVTAIREIQCETATPVYDVQLSGGRPFKVGNLGVVTRGSARQPESVSAGR